MLAILAESALRSLILGSVVWVGLNLFRVRNPHLQMMSWVIVLAASLAMPLLMHWTTVTITVDTVPMPATTQLAPANMQFDVLPPEPLASPAASQPGAAVAAPAARHEAVNWWAIITTVYASVAILLLLRLAVGVGLTWRLARSAKP